MNQFTIEVASDLDHEKMTVNINFSNNQVATLSCDQGLEQTSIEILDRDANKVVWTFDFQNFLCALNLAYEKLKEANDP